MLDVQEKKNMWGECVEVVGKEYADLEKKYGKRDVDWELIMQELGEDVPHWIPYIACPGDEEGYQEKVDKYNKEQAERTFTYEFYDLLTIRIIKTGEVKKIRFDFPKGYM